MNRRTKSHKPLKFKRATIRRLSDSMLERVDGGLTSNYSNYDWCSNTCNCATNYSCVPCRE